MPSNFSNPQQIEALIRSLAEDNAAINTLISELQHNPAFQQHIAQAIAVSRQCQQHINRLR